VTRVRVLAGGLLLGAVLVLASPASDAPAATADPGDPALRVRGGRVGDRVVFRIGVRAPETASGEPATLFLRSTRPLRWRCRGGGCPAPGISARAFDVRLLAPDRLLVTAAGGTTDAVVLDASVVAAGTTLAAERRRAEAAHAAATVPAKSGGGSLVTILLGLGAAVAAGLAVLAARRVRLREDQPWDAGAAPVQPPARGGPAGAGSPEHEANLWELVAAARAHPLQDPREAAQLDALLFELRQHAGLDGRIPGHLAALVVERGR
jgi:hypothetical protein